MEEQSGSQTDYHMNRPDLARQVGWPEKSYGQLHYFHEINTFSYDICLTSQLADLAHSNSNTNSSILHCSLTWCLLGHRI